MGIFAFVGGIFLFFNCLKLHKDKEIKGVSIVTSIFFFLWSVWNLYYFYELKQWFSLIGGIFMSITNGWWIIIAIYFKKKYETI